MQHDDAIGERADDVHLVLDEQDDLALVLLQPADQVEHDRHLVDAHPGGRLVEHEDLGLQRHHQRDFELALVAMRERRCGDAAAAAEGDLIEDRIGPRDQVAPRHPRTEQVVMGAALRLDGEAHILFHAEIRKQIGELERAPEARAGAQRSRELGDIAAIEQDGAG